MLFDRLGWMAVAITVVAGVPFPQTDELTSAVTDYDEQADFSVLGTNHDAVDVVTHLLSRRAVSGLSTDRGLQKRSSDDPIPNEPPADAEIKRGQQQPLQNVRYISKMTPSGLLMRVSIEPSKAIAEMLERQGLDKRHYLLYTLIEDCVNRENVLRKSNGFAPFRTGHPEQLKRCREQALRSPIYLEAIAAEGRRSTEQATDGPNSAQDNNLQFAVQNFGKQVSSNIQSFAPAMIKNVQNVNWAGVAAGAGTNLQRTVQRAPKLRVAG